MPAATVRLFTPRIAAASIAVLTLASCERGAPPPDHSALELGWARAALERNPQIEVVASDAQARVFTIRDRRSGEVQIVKLDEIAAAPIERLQPAPVAQVAASEPAVPAPDAATSPPATPEQREEENAAAGEAPRGADYTIERAEGRLRVTGPGVSIVSSGEPTGATPAGGAYLNAPIVCEGRRMMHLNDREISVEGDAVTVRRGCEIFITNSRIVATGTGVVARGGVVHVSNSHIEGAQGSFDADGESKMYLRGSTFEGLSRRHELAMIQDQGGNRWR